MWYNDWAKLTQEPYISKILPRSQTNISLESINLSWDEGVSNFSASLPYRAYENPVSALQWVDILNSENHTLVWPVCINTTTSIIAADSSGLYISDLTYADSSCGDWFYLIRWISGYSSDNRRVNATSDTIRAV